MISNESAENLLGESKEELVDMLCNMSELVDTLQTTIKEKNKELDSINNFSCNNCINQETSGSDFPCSDCSVRWDNFWEAKDEA